MSDTRTSVIVTCLVTAAVLVGLGLYTQLAPVKQPAPPPTVEEKRREFFNRLEERAGIVRVEGSRVTVGAKFETLDPVEQETTLSLLTGRVFDMPDAGTLKPAQILTVVDKSGKELATYSLDGLKRSGETWE
jgi:hypothetical protein